MFQFKIGHTARIATEDCSSLCALAYGDQLDKTPHALNNLEQEAMSLSPTHSRMASRIQGQRCFCCRLQGPWPHSALSDAKGAARGLVDEIKAQKAQKEREWAEQAKKTKVKRDKEGIAVIHCRTKATDEKPSRNVEVLFDNKD